ncbi:hypothetical protein [Pseudoalteromonas luteoviolacea]|uniref:Alpha-2-macroglobulin domain-containing protein n=1 Tax=Pseudoalteromonas luteoviolacea S4054 TaxID=1129367 RepID=A0A0F6A576_9GAMM|nr:hypothetical protein [Pseudoalteromonas luteoviolacea]AOT10728.1 hypothetical protein S4054249_23005 [Pseudoalteromonas luteoviolacea]AOT16110.1 hypothetical protein S40542_25505 [Pseudoalteromonas luteoviolacea]AOT20548.1 hypothetical protein S4054_22920 [Pseudoalteromonas luteoviolacea]KKE81258.1 hypothetical protein N479_23040 [Pseudoalteromonas luteoviolacea S4054]KZN68979.1 hypothetical protein N481_22820 [Pseudoalteromonas luteoviolacea S4047-1]
MIHVLLLFFCLFSISLTAGQLKVTDIKFSHQKNHLNQILFIFNKNIAEPGNMPHAQQIEHIQLPTKYKRLCRWRFEGSKSLSCDLYTKVPALFPITAGVKRGFRGVTETLNIEFEQQWYKRDLPIQHAEAKSNKIIISYDASLIMNEGVAERLHNSIDFFSDNEPVQPISTSSEQTANYTQLNFEFKKDIAHTKLMVVLPQGSQLSNEHIKTEQDIVIYSKRARPIQPEFYGLFCQPFGISQYISDYIEITEDEVKTCAPESLAVAFSEPLKNYLLLANIIQNQVDKSSLAFEQPRKHNLGAMYDISLDGDTQYKFSLEGIKGVSGEPYVNTSEAVHFKTRESTPYWRLSNYLGTQLKTSELGHVLLSHRNSKNLKVQYKLINNLHALHAWQSSSVESQNTEFKELKLLNISNKKLRTEQLPIKPLMEHRSGILIYKISGASANSKTETSRISQKSDLETLTASDFNLFVQFGSALSIFTYSFEDNLPLETRIWLTCQKFEKPKFLGTTDENGQLNISHKAIQKVMVAQNSQCWIWAQDESGQAMVQLDMNRQNAIAAHTVFSQPIYQPNEAIDFSIAVKQHTEEGLVARTKNIRAVIKHPNRSSLKALEIFPNSISPQGLIHFSIPTGFKQVGNYKVELYVGSQRVDMYDYIKVAQFTPPEIEFSWIHDKYVQINTPFNVKVRGVTYNGQDADNFTGELRVKFQSIYEPQDSWPEGYDYSHFFETPPENKTQVVQLNERGEGEFTLSSDTPFMGLSLSSQVTSNSGETAFYHTALPYFSRNHYIGTTLEKNKLNVIALTQDGTEIKTNVSISINSLQSDDDKDFAPFVLCSGVTPLYCDIPKDIDDYAEIKIISGDEGYVWKRGYQLRYKEETKKPTKQTSPKLTGKPSTSVGDKYVLSIESPIDGQAAVTIQAGELMRNFFVDVNKGNNDIEIKIDDALIPGFEVTAFVPSTSERIAKSKSEFNQTIKRIVDEAQQKASRNLESLNSISLPKKPSVYGYELSKLIHVTPAEKLVLEVEHPKIIEPNGTLEINITSNQPADAQIWLVNDALFDVSHESPSSVSFQQLYHRFSYHQPWHSVHNQADWLLNTNTDNNILAALFAGQVQYRRRMAALAPSNAKHNKLDQAQSVWLTPITLTANEKKSIEVKLPQLNGRWRLFVLTLNEYNQARYTSTLNTQADIEYQIYAPEKVLLKDKPVAVVVINNPNDHLVKDRVEILFNGTVIKKDSFELGATQSKRFEIPLHDLKSGLSTISIQSLRDTKRRYRQDIEVLKNTVQKRSIFRVDPLHSNSIFVPSTSVIEHARVSMLNSNAPNWEILANYHRHYPHQCLEQTLSRAVSLTYNPVNKVAKNAKLAELLKSSLMQNVSYSGYQYFKNSSTDLMLSAYALLANKWLSNTDYQFEFDSALLDELKSQLMNAIDHTHYTPQHNRYEREWLLWALSTHNVIGLPEIKQIYALGVLDTTSHLLQLQALKSAGEKQEDIESVLINIIGRGYQDQSFNALGSTLNQCLAIQLTEKQDIKEKLFEPVISKQLQIGHFGNTLVDSMCTLALKELKSSPLPKVETHKLHTQNEMSEHRINDAPLAPYYLHLQAQALLSKTTSEFNGLEITREYRIKQGENWQLTDAKNLSVGQLIKVTLTVFSPVEREHVLIKDFLPSGALVLDPTLKKQTYWRWLEKRGIQAIAVSIDQSGQTLASWHKYKLAPGTTQFEYLAEVRYQGEFLAPAATAEMMYIPDIRGQTAAHNVTID